MKSDDIAGWLFLALICSTAIVGFFVAVKQPRETLSEQGALCHRVCAAANMSVLEFKPGGYSYHTCTCSDRPSK